MLLAWGIAFAEATVLIFTVTAERYMVNEMRRDGGPPLGRLLLWPSIWWYGWALLAPLVFALAQRFSFARERWQHSFLVHVGGCATFFFMHVGIQVMAMALPAYHNTHPDWQDAIEHHMVTSIYLNLIIYWAIVGAAHAYTYYRAYRQRELRAVQLESELAQARLKALKTQLQPHFLFNTLHSISTLMYRDVRAADKMVAHLSELLRMALDGADTQEVPLRDELGFVEKYLQIEQIRFGDRLMVEMDISPAVEEALVPNLVLQPIVENALKHGLAPRSGPGHIEIKAWAEGERLCLRVADDGVGLQGTSSRSNGIGLSNISARLERLYGEDHTLTLRHGEPSGLIVEMTLPLQRVQETVAV